MLLGWDHLPHQGHEVIVEQRIHRALVDPPWGSVQNLDRAESDPLHFLDEVTLRQGPGHSAGPGRRMCEDFGWKRVLLDRDVGDAETASGFQNPSTFGQDPDLA